MSRSEVRPELYRSLMRDFFERGADEAARVTDSLSVSEISRVLAMVPATSAANVLARLTAETAAQVLAHMEESVVGVIVPLLNPARASSLLARLEANDREKILTRLDSREAGELRALIAYPEDSAGSLMDPRVMSYRPETRVEDVLKGLRAVRDRGVQNIFVVDGESRLTAQIALQELALAAPEDTLHSLPQQPPVTVQATASREEVVDELSGRKIPSLPVVDFEGRLVGVIRYDALVAAVQDEVSADMQTMVGASRDERALSKVSFAVRKRLPWLQINLLTAFLAASVVAIFEDTIARFTALAVLLPVVAGQSGNTGAQALAVTMRGLAVREVRIRHWWRVSVKELNVAVVNGIFVALTTALGVFLWSRSVGLVLVIALSMVISMAAAGISGAIIPMALTRLGQDPAQSSSIVLTTVTDVVGFFSFLGIATLLMSML